MFDIGPEKILIILLLGLLIFGAKRLPELGRGLGKGLREFRQATTGLADDVKAGVSEAPSPRKAEAPTDEGAAEP